MLHLAGAGGEQNRPLDPAGSGPAAAPATRPSRIQQHDRNVHHRTRFGVAAAIAGAGANALGRCPRRRAIFRRPADNRPAILPCPPPPPARGRRKTGSGPVAPALNIIPAADVLPYPVLPYSGGGALTWTAEAGLPTLVPGLWPAGALAQHPPSPLETRDGLRPTTRGRLEASPTRPKQNRSITL